MFAFTSTEADISLEMALRAYYQGQLCHREIDLVEALPPPVSSRGIEATIGSDSVTATDEDPNL